MPCLGKHVAAQKGGLFCGGSARMVEAALKMEGDDILYVGDHIYTDAALAKINFRWRTALIVRPSWQTLNPKLHKECCWLLARPEGTRDRCGARSAGMQGGNLTEGWRLLCRCESWRRRWKPWRQARSTA